MYLTDLIQYLQDNDCELDSELETDEFYVVVNRVTARVGQVAKDRVISSHTCVVLFRALNIPCTSDLEDYQAVLEAHEHAEKRKKIIFPDRQN